MGAIFQQEVKNKWLRWHPQYKSLKERFICNGTTYRYIGTGDHVFVSVSQGLITIHYYVSHSKGTRNILDPSRSHMEKVALEGTGSRR